MKHRRKHTTKCNGISGLNVREGEITICSDGHTITVQIGEPNSRVWVDGEEFTKDGKIRVITKTAPIKYSEEILLEMASLVRGGITVTRAAEELAKKCDYDPYNLRQAYYQRGIHNTRGRAHLSEESDCV